MLRTYVWEGSGSIFMVFSVKALRRSCRGGAIQEFLITLPVVAILFTGIFELGRKVTQASWLAPTTFNVALWGASISDASLFQYETTDRANTLFNNSPNQEIPYSTPPFQSQLVPGDQAGDQNVQVTFDGSMRSLLPHSFDLGVHLTTTVPSLVSLTSVSNLNQFQNLGGDQYCSNGSRSSNCNEESAPPTSWCEEHPEQCANSICSDVTLADCVAKCQNPANANYCSEVCDANPKMCANFCAAAGESASSMTICDDGIDPCAKDPAACYQKYIKDPESFQVDCANFPNHCISFCSATNYGATCANFEQSYLEVFCKSTTAKDLNVCGGKESAGGNLDGKGGLIKK